jgi:predicted anti-sigma-YlaC factor YlaD
MRRFAVNRIGDALATGGSTFETDDDVELVGEALPFGLKLIESLLAESPQHEGLLLAGCRGFTLYAYGYVQQEADRTAAEDLERANALRRRARRLFERASAYGFRALEKRYPGMRQAFEKDPVRALRVARDPRHVPLLYWNAAALGLAISAARGDAAMLARLPEVEALIDRALALDERWNDGAIHEFQVIYASTRPGAGGFDATRLRKHFERAVELSGGRRASAFVGYAETVLVREQKRAEFRRMLERALEIDPDKDERSRLMNLIAQRRARWLLGRIDELFLEEEPREEKEVGK